MKQQLTKTHQGMYTRAIKPFLHLLRKEHIVEVSVNAPDQIFIETFTEGYTQQKNCTIEQQAIEGLAKALASINGQTFGKQDRYLYAVLPDKPFRLTFARLDTNDLIILSIRKLSKEVKSLTAFGFSDELIAQLQQDVQSYKNIVIGGATGSGKTTLTNSLLQHLDKQDRIISIQDISELHISVPNHLPAKIQTNIARAELHADFNDLINACCRLNPTRIILGELSIYNTMPMLNAMNTGHSGCMITMHANSAEDCIHKIALNASMATQFEQNTAERLVKETVDVIYHLKRQKTQFTLERMMLS